LAWAWLGCDNGLAWTGLGWALTIHILSLNIHYELLHITGYKSEIKRDLKYINKKYGRPDGFSCTCAEHSDIM